MHQKKEKHALTLPYSDLKLRPQTTTEKQHFAHHLGRTRLNVEFMLQHKSTIGIPFSPHTELITMEVNQFLLVFILHNLNTTQANCQARCEQTNGRTTDTGMTNRSLVGHSFKNFTVNKPFDCHRLCFVEKCRCQAYQMKGKHSCELLDEDRFAAPDDFVEEQGYEYYDMSREYTKAVRYYGTINLKTIQVTKKGFQGCSGRSKAWRTLTHKAPF